VTEKDSKPYHHEISLDDDEGPVDWASALAELEKNSPVNPEDADHTPIPTVRSDPASPAKQPADRQPAGITRASAEGRSKYQELAKKRSVTITTEDLKTLDELADILSSVNIANALLDGFIRHHPDAINQRLLDNWRSNLKETAQIMMREFHQLRHGKDKKVYDPRHVCRVCHTVYLSELPDGICDECRANSGEKSEGSY